MALGRLRDAWADVVGEHIASRSEPIRLQRGVLAVRVEGGSWAAEITLLAGSIVKKADGFLGGGLVREVKVHAGGGPSQGDNRFTRPPG